MKIGSLAGSQQSKNVGEMEAKVETNDEMGRQQLSKVQRRDLGFNMPDTHASAARIHANVCTNPVYRGEARRGRAAKSAACRGGC